MIPAVADRKQLVDEIVSALTGLSSQQKEELSLVEQMSRAANEVDARTASAFGNALLDSLCEEPGNVRLLEALMILGLAHPDVLNRRGISLVAEGRRLAILLEQRGETDRARCLLELIAKREGLPADEVMTAKEPERDQAERESLVQENMERARRAVKSGRISQAIALLQEVLVADRTRRDVARMIRDLRYQESELILRRRKLRRISLILLSVVGLAGAVGWREYRIYEEFKALPEASDEETSLRQRASAMRGLMQEHGYFASRFLTSRALASLESRLAEKAEQTAQAERQLALEREDRQKQAEAARLRGLMSVERDEYGAALDDFRKSLELSEEGWVHRERVLADIAALEVALEKKP